MARHKTGKSSPLGSEQHLYAFSAHPWGEFLQMLRTQKISILSETMSNVVWSTFKHIANLYQLN